jgi:hypothetical protein
MLKNVFLDTSLALGKYCEITSRVIRLSGFISIDGQSFKLLICSMVKLRIKMGCATYWTINTPGSEAS